MNNNLQKCKDCWAHHTGAHQCDGLMKGLVERQKIKATEKEIIHTEDKECDFCGIRFAHKHKAGSLPNQLIMLEKAKQELGLCGSIGEEKKCGNCKKDHKGETYCDLPKYESWEDEFDKEFSHECNEDFCCAIPSKAYLPECDCKLKEIKSFIKKVSEKAITKEQDRFKKLIEDELYTAHIEGDKTSRLTSLYNKI